MTKKTEKSFISRILHPASCFLLLACCVLFLICNAEAGIVVKIAAVNPSPDIEKEVELKAFLPKEVRPEHIFSLGDLELDFDTQQNVYYVHKNFTLAPRASVVREVEIEDIWIIDAGELELVSKETEKYCAICRGTEFASQASFLKNNIDSKLNQIIQLQQLTTVTPQEHISDYRKNLERLREIKADLASLKSLAKSIKPISSKLIWRLILLVVGFLGIVAGAFMYVWHRYLKSSGLERIKPPEGEGL